MPRIASAISWGLPANSPSSRFAAGCGGKRPEGGGFVPHACAPSRCFSVGSFLIAFPVLASANRSSYSAWRLSQNSGLVPKKCARRSAVSPVIARCPFRIPVTRFVGTAIRRPSSAALVVGFVLIFYLGNWFTWPGWALVGWVCFQVVKWEGIGEGYLHGYEFAREEAFVEMLGLSEEEQNDLHSRSMEMEIDERVVKAFDRKK